MERSRRRRYRPRKSGLEVVEEPYDVGEVDAAVPVHVVVLPVAIGIRRPKSVVGPGGVEFEGRERSDLPLRVPGPDLPARAIPGSVLQVAERSVIVADPGISGEVEMPAPPVTPCLRVPGKALRHVPGRGPGSAPRKRVDPPILIRRKNAICPWTFSTMTPRETAFDRLWNQQIASTGFTEVEQVVAWLGAVQAQDYQGARWSIGLRLPGNRAEDVDRAIAGGRIVLTWALRGTLHLVAAADVRWMLALLAPRIVASRASRYRQLGLDERDFSACNRLLERELKGGRRLSRRALLSSLESSGISTDGQRGYHLLGRAGLDGVICFGPMQGREQTFVLLSEWVPRSEPVAREAALRELAVRYFASHGPATLQDFTWWSGLTAADPRSGIAAAGPDLRREAAGDLISWRADAAPPRLPAPPFTVLLPAFDEYILGYRDRSHAIDRRGLERVRLVNGLAQPILVDGRVRGTWRRTFVKDTVRISLSFLDPPDGDERLAAVAAAERYGRFVGRPVEIA
jgi:hypothetical protein